MKVLLSVILILLAAAPALASQKLVLTMPQAEPSYIAFDLLKAAYAKLDIELESWRLPSGRSLEESNSGASDGEVDRIFEVGDTYTNLIRIPQPVTHVEYVAFVCQDDLLIHDINSIGQYRVGILRGFKYAENATAHMDNVYRAESWDKLFTLLSDGRVDVAFAPRRALPMKSRPGWECIRAHEPPLAQVPLYHYLNKKHTDLVPRITTVLRAMFASGEAEIVYKKAQEERRQREFKR
ncbi:transporter substrate-binding domain-containing protein [Pseudodesulfovibrio sp. zrk46]|uniref:substrate-binding periplasmic protein n=1 Tax=Pseudodesulfovibrio sp. zrk46 TaxID=2725288 RepID=UPI00144A27A7|nr:transporter substrate-binding domain-containing protein [Pseudodesulfovibrio sp. zrk46]QJB57012.1 transporter substrate-binding domain-containing protein [Pseudodesulfovibrio sp. zrk46]